MLPSIAEAQIFSHDVLGNCLTCFCESCSNRSSGGELDLRGTDSRTILSSLAIEFCYVRVERTLHPEKRFRDLSHPSATS